MSETVKLSLEILKRLSKVRYTSAPEIQQQLADAGTTRTLRSVERQLLALSEQFEIERDTRSKPYGYRWKSNATGFKVPGFTPQESVLLMLAERHLQNILPNKILKSLEGYFSQARKTLNNNHVMGSKASQEWLAKVDIVSPTQPLLAPEIKAGIMRHVSDALQENRWLLIDYQNAAGYASSYRVMPLALVQQDVRLYLVCRFEGYTNERNLALHRIQTVKVQTLTFKRPPEFNLKKYIADGRFGVGDSEEIQLSFKVLKEAGKHLLETPLSECQTVEEHDDYLEISAKVIQTEVLDRWLLSFGNTISHVTKTSL